MHVPRLPENESERLRSLHSLCILDTEPEERFDRLTRLAATVLEVPIAIVSLIDADRQWFKSRMGLEESETPRAISFCGHAILTPDLMIVEDARRDERFHDNPLVAAGPRLQFYAGAPLRDCDCRGLGTLCVLDQRPRAFSLREQAVLADLASLVERELFLSRSEDLKRLQKILDCVPVSVAYKSADGRYQTVNRAWERVTHLRSENVIGKTLTELSSNEIASAVERAEADFLMGNDEVATSQVAWGEADDSVLASLHRAKIRDGAGNVEGHVVTALDVTELARCRNELTLAHRAATATQETTANVLSFVHHGLRRPANAVIGTAHLLARTALSEEQAEYVHTIALSTDLISDVVEDMRAVVDGGFAALSFERSPVSLLRALEDTVDMVTVQARAKNLELLYTIDRDVPPCVMGDPLRIRQVLLALIDHAIKCSTSGEVIVICKLVSPQIGQTPANVEFNVADTGDGLCDTSTLGVCKGLVSLLGGELTVNRIATGGSRFSFTLAAQSVEESNARIARIRLPEPPPWVNAPKHVLVVDDNVSSCVILKKQVEQWLCTVETVTSGAEALARLTQTRNIDAVIIDEAMPGMDGKALARALCEHSELKALPLVLLSSTRAVAGNPTPASFCASVTKPVHARALLEALTIAFEHPAQRR
jgi:PAS domain S-box-containing protein